MFDHDMTEDQVTRLHGGAVYDQDGDKIGSVGQVYLDDETGRPAWATVSTGWFGTKETFVPLDRADLRGDDIHVPYTKSHVKDAPNIEADGHISPDEEAELYRYYSMDYNRGVADYDRDRGDVDRDYDRERVDVDRDRVDVDRDREGDSVVRREEELHVGKERVATGRVRLRKHVVTEQKTVTVPVEREEYTIEREPVDGRSSGGRIGEDEVSMELTEERPVVAKEVVDKERVGLRKDTVTEDRQVSESVAREEVDIDHDADRTRTADYDRDDRSLKDKAKDALDRDNDGKIG